jgi:hypothetical protein
MARNYMSEIWANHISFDDRFLDYLRLAQVNGADLNTPPEEGEFTLLHYLFLYSPADTEVQSVVKFFLISGADPSVKAHGYGSSGKKLNITVTSLYCTKNKHGKNEYYYRNFRETANKDVCLKNAKYSPETHEAFKNYFMNL